MSIFGRIYFRIKGDSINKLINRIIHNRAKCRNLSVSDSVLTGSCSPVTWGTINKWCYELNLDAEIHTDKSLYTVVKWLLNRKGLIAGFIFGLAIITVLSNLLMRVRIIGCGSELEKKITDYLEYREINYGMFIPDIDFYDLELDILQDVDGVSWVGIYNTGGTLNIDVIPTNEKPDYSQRRLPSNLIASHEGQIVRTEIFGGRLVVPIGSGVHKGQLLVSGETKLSEEKTVYHRSQGSVYAEYTEEMVFECPFIAERKVLSENSTERTDFSFFGIEMPLNISDKPQGKYDIKENKKSLSFLGLELPLGIVRREYTQYDFETTEFTEKQATEEVYKLKQNYEKNFLSDCEVVDESENLEKTADGMKLTVSYTVIADIAVEKEILIK